MNATTLREKYESNFERMESVRTCLFDGLLDVLEAAEKAADVSSDWKTYFSLPEDEDTDWAERDKMLDELSKRSKEATDAIPAAIAALYRRAGEVMG